MRLIGHLDGCCVLCRRERVQVDEAAIHQYYWVTLRSGRFTAANRGADWKRNEQCVLIAERVCHPLLIKLSTEQPKELCFLLARVKHNS